MGLIVGFCILEESPASIVNRTSDRHVHSPATKTIPDGGSNLTVAVVLSTWHLSTSVLIPVFIHNVARIFRFCSLWR